MRVLVTGGLGYLGGRISQHLASCGFDVIVTSRQPVEPPHWLKGRGQVVSIDLENPSLTGLGSLDAVIHLAALNEVDCAKSPLDSLRVNTVGTLNLINAVAKITDCP